MHFTAVYLVERFFYRIADFLRHWYVKSARMYSNFVMERFESIDRVLAWKITAKNIFKPLYGDYSLVGYVFGFLFRFVRLFVATVVYICVFIVAVIVYLLWIFLPAFLLYKTLSS